jgi:hypothetical protein
MLIVTGSTRSERSRGLVSGVAIALRMEIEGHRRDTVPARWPFAFPIRCLSDQFYRGVLSETQCHRTFIQAQRFY